MMTVKILVEVQLNKINPKRTLRNIIMSKLQTAHANATISFSGFSIHTYNVKFDGSFTGDISFLGKVTCI